MAAITSSSHIAHTQTSVWLLPVNEKIIFFFSSYEPNLLFKRNFPHLSVVDTGLLAIAKCLPNIYGCCSCGNDAWGAEITPTVCTSVSENKHPPQPAAPHMPFISIISQENTRSITTRFKSSSNCHLGERGWRGSCFTHVCSVQIDSTTECSRNKGENAKRQSGIGSN